MTECVGQPQNAEDVRKSIFEAYVSIVDAYLSGGNVSGLIDDLNEAILLVKMAEENSSFSKVYLDKAFNISEYVKYRALDVKRMGENARFNYYLTIALSVSLLIACIILLYVYGRTLYWRLWLKARYNNKIVWRKFGGKRKSMIIDEEVWAVILAIIVVSAVFAISQICISGRVVEPFSELGILGSKMKIGDYPRELVLGEKAKLYIYVGNHMGRPMYYIVKIKIGNRTTPVDPAPIPPIKVYEKILDDNSTWIFPFQISFNETGLNYRLIVELWIYNSTSNQIEYHSRWCQLWINVTQPKV